MFARRPLRKAWNKQLAINLLSDSFLRDRQAHDHEATAMMKAQFMSLWDGFASTNDQVSKISVSL